VTLPFKQLPQELIAAMNISMYMIKYTCVAITAKI
jgi:hypothetical protein